MNVQCSSTVIDVGTCDNMLYYSAYYMTLSHSVHWIKHYQPVIVIWTLERSFGSSSRSSAAQLSNCNPLVVKTKHYNFRLWHVALYVVHMWSFIKESSQRYIFFSFRPWYLSLSLFLDQCFELQRNAIQTHFTSDRWKQYASYVINSDSSPPYFFILFY